MCVLDKLASDLFPHRLTLFPRVCYVLDVASSDQTGLLCACVLRAQTGRRRVCGCNYMHAIECSGSQDLGSRGLTMSVIVSGCIDGVKDSEDFCCVR